MAARKLQAEMDRTFKKITEGVENFEDVEGKMNAAGTPAQKEKLEADLKTQIKKLQRLRDQLKTWQAGSDVKDKAPIIDHRRLIETQMERFKLIEKEMKTKAYSTVGLVSHSKLDPREQQRLDLIQWLQGKVEELQQQVESAEAELETLQAGAKKKGKAQEVGAARQELLETQNGRREWHISQLEIILRLVENSSLKTEAVEKIKDDVDFFVGSNTEEDFEYDDGVYADLDLDKYIEADMDEEGTVASDAEAEDLPPRVSTRKATKVEEEEIREETPSKKSTATRPKVTEAVVAKPTAAAPNYVQQPMASVVKSGPAPRATPSLPPLRYSAAAAMGTSTAPSQTTTPTVVVPATPASVQAPAPPPRASTPPTAAPANSSNTTTTGTSTSGVQHITPQSKSATPASEKVAPVSPSEPAASSAVVSPVASPVAVREKEPSVVGGGLGQTGSYGGAPSAPSVTSMSLASPVVSVVEAPASASPQVSRMANPSPLAVQATTAQNPQYTLQGILPQNPPAHPGMALNGLREAGNASTMTMKAEGAPRSMGPSPGDELSVGSNPPNGGAGAIGSAYGQQSGVSPPGLSANGHEERSQGQPKFAATLSDLMSSFKSVGLKAPDRMRDSEQVKDVLEIMSPSMPQPRDAERPKYHTTRNPKSTPAYYPQQVLPLLASPEFFERLDVETLFWVFYYMPGTYQQWLAAQELKKQSWRFHVKFLTWFQRHAKPDEVTDEYEQGQYLYFDWEGSWCVRKKSDFRFEYRNLSDD